MKNKYKICVDVLESGYFFWLDVVPDYDEMLKIIEQTLDYASEKSEMTFTKWEIIDGELGKIYLDFPLPARHLKYIVDLIKYKYPEKFDDLDFIFED